MIRGIHHIAIATTDIDRLMRFYKEAFGFEEISRGRWEPGNAVNDAIVGLRDSSASTGFLRAGNILLEMFEYHAPKGAPNTPNRPPSDCGYTHFCLDVTDIDSEVERLSELGMTFHGPVPSASDMGGRMRAIYGRDPDGNIIELIEFFDTSLVSYLDFDGDPVRA